MHQDTSLIALPASFSSLGILLDRVAAACRDAAFDIECSRRVELAIEELFVNTVHHAYGGESDRPVWIKLSPAAGRVSIEYQDAGPPFDPLEAADHPGNNAPPNLTVGGLGRRLIADLATAGTYERRDGRNVIRLDFSRGPQTKSEF